MEGVLDRRRRAALLGLLLLPVLILAPKRITDSLTEAHDAKSWATQWSVIISDARQTRGPVLCEVLAVCFWAGKPMALDFFAYGQKLRTGTDASHLRAFIAHKSAALIILDRHFAQHAGGETRLPAPFPQLMRETYKRVRIAPPYLDELAPR
jgi:hypothetical protein